MTIALSHLPGDYQLNRSCHRVREFTVLLLQVSSPESSYDGDGEAEKVTGEDLLKHLGENQEDVP